MKSVNRFDNCNRFRLGRRISLIDFKLFFVSIVTAFIINRAPYANETKHATKRKLCEHIMYCNITAIKYPAGFFVSNGNLQMGN